MFHQQWNSSGNAYLGYGIIAAAVGLAMMWTYFSSYKTRVPSIQSERNDSLKKTTESVPLKPPIAENSRRYPLEKLETFLYLMSKI